MNTLIALFCAAGLIFWLLCVAFSVVAQVVNGFNDDLEDAE